MSGIEQVGVKQAVLFRAYPTTAQQAMLRSWMGARRFVWNPFVAHDKDLSAARRRFAFHGDLSAFLPERKRIEGYGWLADVPAISLVACRAATISPCATPWPTARRSGRARASGARPEASP